MIGHSIDDLQQLMGTIGSEAEANEVLAYLRGNRPGGLQKTIANDAYGLTKAIPGVGIKTAAKVGRFAGKAAPLLSAVTNVADVGDIILGDESLANKAMDTAAMGAGGTAGFMLGGPLGASIGASLGKTVSDGAQYLFGDKKTPEQRKLEQALALLNRGGL